MNQQQRIDHFISTTRELAKKHDVELYMGRGKFVKLDDLRLKSAGYFDCDRLAVAQGLPKEMWLGVLVHESCHMDQWIEDCKYWRDAPDEVYDIEELIITGKKVHLSTARAAIDRIIMLEADCERRAIEKIKAFNLPLDVVRYTQSANCYLYFYSALLHYRCWYKVPPYKVAGLRASMPTRMKQPEDYRVAKANVDVTLFEKVFKGL